MKPIHVLVLDDEENILKSVARMFINDSFSVATTTVPSEALEILSKQPIRVVISDQRMPSMSGVDFLRKVKEVKPEVIRILFTGYSDIEAVEEAINVGEVYRYINKPWNVNDFKNTVVKAMAHVDLMMENRRLFEETQLKNCELEAANEMLKIMFDRQRDFTSTVSHELRTPLASIKTAIDIVLTKTPGPINEDQSEFLGRAKNNVDRLARLINDILDLTKLEEGRAPLNIQETSINTVINEVVILQKEVAKTKKLKLEAILDEQVDKVDLDPDKIYQVLNNLITNAIKFTEQGSIEVKTQLVKEDNAVLISVSDTGRGIEAVDMDKLFKKFQQLGDASKRTGGTGLGLAICKEIIRQHGGRIWVESSIGKGSQFNVFLPIKA